MFYTGRRSEQANKACEIKDSVRRDLALADETVVTVSELKCAQSGCPPLETMVALLGLHGQSLQGKIHLPALEIKAERVQQLCERSDRDLYQQLQLQTTLFIGEETCDGL
jgi:hypothetical protein